MNPSVAAQYSNDTKLQMRIQTHKLYTVGPSLEAVVDDALVLKGNENILDVGCGPADFLGRLKQVGHTVGLQRSKIFSFGFTGQHSQSVRKCKLNNSASRVGFPQCHTCVELF